jgi:hypothetical protein
MRNLQPAIIFKSPVLSHRRCHFHNPVSRSSSLRSSQCIKMESDRVLDGDDVDYTCPLCVEEFDIHDRNFKPCPCGYQVCPFCWNHIRNNLNGLCPACRRPYSDQPEWKPTAVEEYPPSFRARKLTFSQCETRTITNRKEKGQKTSSTRHSYHRFDS